MPAERDGGFLALRDRAEAALQAHGTLEEATLLRYVYGGQPPAALFSKLVEPLLGDPRLQREDALWSLRRGDEHQQPPSHVAPLTTFSVATTGSHPARGRIVRIAALHVADGQVVQRFTATVHPGKRVPAYVTRRLGLEPDLLEELAPFDVHLLDDLLAFLGSRPLAAQDATLAWTFVLAEARRLGRTLPQVPLIDANALASRILASAEKPSIGLVAAKLGISSTHLEQPEEEARILAVVVPKLLAMAASQGLDVETAGKLNPTTLQRAQTANSLPDQPGVYIFRDEQQTALYVGKARRLRSRVAAYVNRPVGQTRKLEGLVGSVQTVDRTVCRTDLEALVLEDRQIRDLQPRFNTVRRQRLPRLWIRLAPASVRAGKRQPALPRLEASLGPAWASGEFVGPFRNETAAQQARGLARAVFDLDRLRHLDGAAYQSQLIEAWRFLQGERELAERRAREASLPLLRRVLAFDLATNLLPADPHLARYAVVRPTLARVEVFVIDRGVLTAHAEMEIEDEGDAARVIDGLLNGQSESRTEPRDAPVVVRWLGAQRSPARLVLLPTDPLRASDTLEDAVASAFASRLAEP